MIDLKRDARQEEVLDKWSLNKGIGGFEGCPRFGKTNVGIKAINKHRFKYNDSRVVIIVPSESIEKHWKSHIKSIDYYNNAETIVMTSNSAKNHISELTNKLINLLIVDELHKYTSEQNTNLLKELSNHSKFRLSLTANHPYNNTILNNLFPVIDKVPEEEARENGWISDYYEYNIPTSLSDNEKIKYAKYSEYITETLELFRGKAHMIDKDKKLLEDDYHLIMSCYTGTKSKNGYIKGEYIRSALAKIMGWNRELDLNMPRNKMIDVVWRPENIYERAKQFKNFVEYRNNILVDNQDKLNKVLDILKFNDVPTIIFNESTDFANRLANAIGDKAILYHSKIKSRPMIDEDGKIITTKSGKPKMFGSIRLKNLAIEGFKSKRYKYLITVKSLNEGLDLPEIQQVIITGGTTNPIEQVQRSARGKTTDSFNPDKLTFIFNLYTDNFKDVIGNTVRSRDLTKLMQRQSKYTHSVQWLNSLSEITL